MKRVVLLFTLIYCVMPVFSQIGLRVNKANQDGSLLIATDEKWYRTGFTDTHPMGFSIIAKYYEGEYSYLLQISINSMKSFKIPNGALLLIKTLDNEVIELKQTLEDYNTEDIIGEYIPYANTSVHTMYSLYPISENELTQIANSGIIKIRIETEFQNLDSEYKSKKAKTIGHDFTEMIFLIKNQSLKGKNIRDGF
ncbi:hypothetical protein [Phocaeicola sp.]